MPSLPFDGGPDRSDRAMSRSRHQAQDSQRVFSVDAHEITTGPVLGPTIGSRNAAVPKHAKVMPAYFLVISNVVVEADRKSVV